MADSMCRLQLLVALCPKMFDWKWRSGMFNLRFRYHEDPGYCGVGRKLGAEDLHSTDPVGEDSKFMCCAEARRLNKTHTCDKWSFLPVMHRVALQYQEYILDGEDEWDMTAQVATKLFTDLGLWTGESIDHRPEWLVDACDKELIEELRLKLLEGQGGTEKKKSPLKKDAIDFDDIYGVGEDSKADMDNDVLFEESTNPLFTQNGDGFTINVEMMNGGWSLAARREHEHASLKKKLLKAKGTMITDVAPLVEVVQDTRNKWHQHDAGWDF